ncbi:Sin3 associated polypeptide p18-domain-containing protein, partial [Sporodiniella umbellata]
DCPFLLRVFTRHGGHNPKNATLEEIAQLIEQVVPEARNPEARISFRIVYLNQSSGKFFTKEMGRVVSAKPTKEQTKTLEECKFIIGDFLDVAIYIGPPPMLGGGRDARREGRPGGRMEGGRFGGRGGGSMRAERRPFARDNNNRFGGRSRRDF